tara:strand:+ start:1401 stop:3158 length:1758 start_codon:yes stop_codon:yes gene_type:complete
MARLLVVTPIKETWGNEKEVIFLGEWCKLYSCKKSWHNLNHSVIPYHWDDRNKLYKDYKYLINLYENLLIRLSSSLNHIHGVNYPEKYWRILIGPWLGIYLQVVFDRWEMIRKALELNEELFSIITESNISKYVPNDMSEFLNFISSDDWNQSIFESIILEKNNIKTKKIKFKFKSRVENPKTTIRHQKFKNIYKFLVKLITPSNAPFIISSYLSWKNEIKIGLKNKCIPIRINTRKPKDYNFSSKKRNFKINYNPNNSFEKFILNSITLQIPKAYLEGYKNLIKEVENLGWQKTPKYIFTSNSYWEDDLFKCYSAMKSLKNIPLFIGQHGGHYGTGKFSFAEDHQLSISDKYISWGWTQNKHRNKIIPIGCLKKQKLKKNLNSKNTKLLLITCTLPRYSYHLYSILISSQWINYFKDQCRFVDLLDQKIKSLTTVRLFKIDLGWDQLLRWKTEFPELNYDLNTKPLISQLKKAKLVVSTYNATTFLESMSMNIPTVIFWNPNHWELRDDAIPFYDELERAKIFHKDPASASKHINNIWESIQFWWRSKKVQEARDLFLNKYCRREDNLAIMLDKEFNKHSKINK